jgi:hypothetical protein
VFAVLNPESHHAGISGCPECEVRTPLALAKSRGFAVMAEMIATTSAR